MGPSEGHEDGLDVVLTDVRVRGKIEQAPRFHLRTKKPHIKWIRIQGKG